MDGLPERAHEGAAPAAPEASPAPPAAAAMPGLRSDADIARALARADPNARAALARSLQGGAGNRAFQRFAARTRQLQRYKDTNKAGEWKAADSAAGLGRIADNGETVTFSTHVAYATADLITRSNGMLAIKGSAVTLYALKDTKTIEAPDGSGTKTLYRIGVDIKSDPNNKTISADCREAALDVAGTGPGGGPEKLTITEGGRLVEVEGEKGDASDAAVRALLIDKKVHETPNYATLDDAARKKLAEDAQSGVGGMRRQDRENVRATAVSDDRAKETGIDFYANPGVGDAFTSVTAPAPGPGQYRFHFATVIMAPGQDRVTLENEGESPGVRNEKWKIETYSLTEPRKSFHREHSALTSPGHTFVVRTGPPPPADSAAIIRMTTPDLIVRYLASSSREEKLYIERELLKKAVNVVVAVDHTDDDDVDDVYALVASSTFKRVSTGITKLKAGDKAVLKVPLERIWPLTNEIVVDVFDQDALSADDLIGTVKWPQPFAPNGEVALAAGSARYRVALDIT